MRKIVKRSLVLIMYTACLASMICPEYDVYLLNGTSSCFCNGTRAQWKNKEDDVVSGDIYSNTSVELILAYNNSDHNATYSCCTYNITTRNETCNDTYTPRFAEGPRDVHLTASLEEMSFNMCPKSQDVIHVSCLAIDVQPELAHFIYHINSSSTGYESDSFNSTCRTSPIQIAGQLESIKQDSLNSTCSFRPSQGGVLNITCTAYNSIDQHLKATNSIYIVVNEPPSQSPCIKINNLVAANDTTTDLGDITSYSLSCSIDGGFPSIEMVNIQCDGLLEARQVKNRYNVTIDNIGCYTTKCHCRTNHVTGCYQSVASVSLRSSMHLYISRNETSNLLYVELNSVLNHTVNITGCPLPNSFKLLLNNGTLVSQMNYNITPYNVISDNLTFSNTTNINVVLSFGPVSEEYFTNFTLVISNGVGPDLNYNFSIAQIKETKDSKHFPLLLGLSISLGGTFVLCLIFILVCCHRSRKRRHTEREINQEPNYQINSNTKFYIINQCNNVQNTDHGTNCTTSSSFHENTGHKNRHNIDQSTCTNSGHSNNYNSVNAIKHSVSDIIGHNAIPKIDGGQIGHNSVHINDHSLSDHTTTYNKNCDHNMYLDHSPVTNRPHKRHTRNCGPYHASSVLCDDNDQPVVSAHLPNIQSIVTLETLPLPGKIGKRIHVYEEKSIYDIPSVRVLCDDNDQPVVSAHLPNIQSIVTLETLPLPGKIGKRIHVYEEKSIYDIPSVRVFGQSVEKDVLTDCDIDLKILATNTPQPVQDNENELVSHQQPPLLHSASVNNNSNVTNADQTDNLICIESNKTSGYVNVIINS